VPHVTNWLFKEVRVLGSSHPNAAKAHRRGNCVAGMAG
jgi:hypothetical protein